MITYTGTDGDGAEQSGDSEQRPEDLIPELYAAGWQALTVRNEEGAARGQITTRDGRRYWWAEFEHAGTCGSDCDEYHE